MTGIKTVWARDLAMPAASTSTLSPASRSMMIGVMIGAMRVETLVIATESATSPFAKKAMTFDEVPPGTEPSIRSPTASAGLSPRTFATTTAPSGMITNWATTPMRTGTGRRTTSWKSGMVRVSPMPNMMIMRK